jgi:glycosyltransferase involved in cell wall biosynthesis
MAEMATTPRPSKRRSVPALSVIVTLGSGAWALAPEELYRRMVAALEPLEKPFELIFVDYRCPDETLARLERLHTADGRLRAIRLKRGFGQHQALHAGLTRAEGEVIVTMNGAPESSPEDIPRLVAALDSGADLASGAWTTGTPTLGWTSPSRFLSNRLLRRLTGTAISDFGCSFNAYRRSALLPLIDAIGKQRFTKLLVLASGASAVEVEVEVANYPYGAGTPNESRHPLLLALYALVSFWPQPIQTIALALGVVCTLAATAVGVYGIAFWIVESDFPGPLLAGGGLLAILAVQGFILALIGEYLARIRRDVEGRPLYTIDAELG